MNIWPPPPMPPGCTTGLIGLQNCYDDIAVMKQIIAQIIKDLMTSDPATVAAIRTAVMTGTVSGTPAAAGQIGELLSNIPAAAVAVPANAWTLVATIALPAGDWNVWGIATWPATIGLTSVGAGVSLTGTTPPAILQTTILTSGAAAGTAPAPPNEFNVSAATSVSLYVNSTVATSQTVALWARRIR